MKKLYKIISIINSCKTQEQLDSCRNWVSKIKGLEESVVKDLIVKTQLNDLIHARYMAMYKR